MRLGERKLICPRKSRVSKRKISGLLIILLILALVVYSGLYFLETVRPAMIENARSKAHRIAQQAINDAVISLFASGGVSYEDILVLKRAEDGKIVAAESNLEGLSLLKSKITMKIQDYIAGLDTAEITLPLGAFFGTDILAGAGPTVSVEFMPDGITEVDFVSGFEDSGINQTRLTVDLDVKTTVGLLMPGASTSVEVETKVPVIQTVIVGDVPDSYTNVERDGYEYEDDVLELAE